jgi:hypothetical protein
MPTIENDENKRSFARIKTFLAMKVRLVSPDEKKYIEKKMGENQALLLKPPSPSSDPAIQEWMQFLDAKLNLILQIIFENQKEFEMPSELCWLSGGGISIVVPEKYAKGDTLELKILYPSYPPQILYLYGEVLRAEKEGDNYLTALKFTMIDDLVRDKIVQLVFDKEREIIRKKKGV